MKPQETYPLASCQEYFVRAYSSMPDPGFHHCPTVLRYAGVVDENALRRSIVALARRHEALRVRYQFDASGAPRMIVDQDLDAKLDIFDCEGGDTAHDEVKRILRDFKTRRFDLERGPLIRFCLVRMHGDESLLGIVMHHSVSDAWSLHVLSEDLKAIYAATAAGRDPALRPVSQTYTAFATGQHEWSASDRVSGLLGEWRERFGPVAHPFLLPADHPADDAADGLRRPPSGFLPPDALQALESTARTQGTTVFSMCLAAFCRSLARWSDKEDVFLSIFHAGRTRPEHFGIVGCLVESWLLPVHLDPADSLGSAVRAVDDARAGNAKFQSIPYGQLRFALAEACGDPAMLDISFNYVAGGRAEESLAPSTARNEWSLDLGFSALAEPGSHIPPQSAMKLYLLVWQSARGLEWTAQYNGDSFARRSVEALCAAMRDALEEAVSQGLVGADGGAERVASR